ncbi:MAG TPA: DUF4440 domain-containing protein [Chryseosolibacter sp.]|nr:DUF4440 domain-containing protein [Chryseosolibacter sp.]
MKKLFVITTLTIVTVSFAAGQSREPSERQKKDLSSLIDQYSQSRETRDTVLLRSILAADIDQLVSTGEWRAGIRSAIQGMMASSSARPGKRTLTVDRIKLVSRDVAIVDCRYEIENADGSMRSMWSAFVAVNEKGKWKISAIRNMLPASAR